MIPTKWKVLKSEFVAELKIFQARFDYLLNPHTNKEIKVTVLEANDAANVVSITPEKKVLMVRQFRFGSQDFSLEIPGGFIENNESPLEGVKRELIEETGYTSDNWKPIGTIYSNPVYQNAKIHHFVATDVRKTDETHFDREEHIEVEYLSPTEIIQAVKSNQITHPHTISALCRLYNLSS